MVAGKSLLLKKPSNLRKTTAMNAIIFWKKDTRINPMIWVIFKNNSKYRVLSNLYLQYVQKIMHREDAVLDKSGEIDVDKYLNHYE